MSQASYKNRNSHSLAERILSSREEITALLLFGLTVFLMIAMWTFNVVDPGWSNVSDSTSIENSAGLLGAWIADFLLYWLGYPAYLVPIILGFEGALIFFASSITSYSFYVVVLRFIGMTMMMLGSCGIASAKFSDTNLPIATHGNGGGGVVGKILSDWIIPIFGYGAGDMVLILLIFIGITLYSGISWLLFFEFVGFQLFRSADKVLYLWNSSTLSNQNDKQQKKERREKLKRVRENIATRIPATVNTSSSPIIHGIRLKKERQEELFENEAAPVLPTLDLLDNPPEANAPLSKDASQMLSKQLELKLADYGIEAKVEQIHPGPVITRFELSLAPGVKASRVVNLDKDLARSLSVSSVRIVEVIPGKPVIGIEIPRENRELIGLSDILGSLEYEKNRSPLPLALGKDVSGNPVIAELNKMPHVLVAGTTGAGKSVALNVMILSLIYRATAEKIRFLMIDPKMLELSVYDGIPHLITPVITDMKQSANALQWCVREMEKRYVLMSKIGVRNISGFNQVIAKKYSGVVQEDKPSITSVIEKNTPVERSSIQENPEQEGTKELTYDFSSMFSEAEGNAVPEADEQDAIQDSVNPIDNEVLEEHNGLEVEERKELPHIVVVVDELADMMMVVGKKAEQLITRLAQKSRAAGIHLILATQRPSVDVITGLIKANVPSRIAFQVSSKIDSRTILDRMGAENLLGHGDMLVLLSGASFPTRVHGAFVSDNEVHRVVDFLKKNTKRPSTIAEIAQSSIANTSPTDDVSVFDEEEDNALFQEAVKIVGETRRVSISYLQRRLRIGYNRAARLVETMELKGIVGHPDNSSKRQVLIDTNTNED